MKKKPIITDEYLKNEYNTNRVLSIFLFVFVIIGSINLVVAQYKAVEELADICLQVFLPLNVLIIATIITARCVRFSKWWVKNVLLAETLIASFLSFCIYGFFTLYLIIIPIVIAARYFNKKVTFALSAASIILFIAGCIINAELEKSNAFFRLLHEDLIYNIWQFPGDVVTYLIIPCLLLILFLCIYVTNMTSSGRKLLTAKVQNTEKLIKMDAEIEMAANIQKSVLPKKDYTAENGNFAIHTFELPAKEVCGDFYDYIPINDHTLGVIVADVSDKGLSAAMFMMSAKKVLKSCILSCKTMSYAVNLANRMICTDNEYGMFLTLWLGIIDTRTGVGKYVNAGHPFPIIRHADGSIEELENEPDLFIGNFPDVNPVIHSFRMKKGDSLFIYTDGLTDSVNTSGESFGLDRVLDCVRAGREVIDEARTFSSGAVQFDDITMLRLDCMNTEEPRNVTKTVPATLTGTGELNDFIMAELSASGCPDETRRNAGVAVDEICNNISQYAYENGGNIEFSANIGLNFVEMTFTDHGGEFNPLTYESDLNDDVLRIGGYGISFVKSLSDDLSYRYENGTNNLTVLFSW